MVRFSLNIKSCCSYKIGAKIFCIPKIYTPVHLWVQFCDRKSRAACAQSFALWQQATIEFTCHDHSPRTLVVAFNSSQVNIGRASTPRSLFYCLFAPHICIICMALFFTHIPFVVNHTTNATPPERLQQQQLLVYNIPVTFGMCANHTHFIFMSKTLLSVYKSDGRRGLAPTLNFEIWHLLIKFLTGKDVFLLSSG